jgi:hypothetical protein
MIFSQDMHHGRICGAVLLHHCYGVCTASRRGQTHFQKKIVCCRPTLPVRRSRGEGGCGRRLLAGDRAPAYKKIMLFKGNA